MKAIHSETKAHTERVSSTGEKHFTICIEFRNSFSRCFAAVLVIQQIEGYVVTPLVQRQVVSMPPAVLLFAIVILVLLFGWLGIILAAPIAVEWKTVAAEIGTSPEALYRELAKRRS